MIYFESKKQQFVFNPKCNWQPVEFSKDRGNMISFLNLLHNTSSRILEHLYFFKIFIRDSIQ